MLRSMNTPNPSFIELIKCVSSDLYAEYLFTRNSFKLIFSYLNKWTTQKGAKENGITFKGKERIGNWWNNRNWKGNCQCVSP
ncbi:hypothetical protein GCM10008986_14650 [Salinibacillus aidingensis]|uniref:Uncharacterized protein n=1 Tax=Salinibacillus aidingensis TaxID=237684 RepID=A0ABP3KZ16_9BACI